MSNSRVMLVLVASIVLMTTVGCGPQTANVSGKVTVNGEPLKTGNLQFQSATGLVIETTIQPDGTYTASNVPLGSAKVSISAMDPKFEQKMLELAGRGKAPVEDGSSQGRGKLNTGGGTDTDWAAIYRLVDEKYAAFESSGLTVNVAAPSTTYDIPATKAKTK